MSLGTQEQRTEGMKRQAQDLIDQSYQRGYKAGYEACKEAKEALIEQGRNEAWEAARKLSDARNVNEILDDTIFYCVNIFERHTASDAIEKLRAYEDKKTQETSAIKVGDEVRFHNRTDSAMFVIKIGKSGFIDGMDAEGNMHINQSPENWIKTGRTLPEVAELLNKLRKVE